MPQSEIATLVLYADYTTRLSYYDDWLDAFDDASEFRVETLNICQRGIKPRLRRAVAEAELIVLLHSTNGDTTIYLEPLAPLLRDRRGLLLSFVGNEVNLPGSAIAAKRAVLQAIEPDFIATQLLAEAGEHLFGDLVRRRVLAIPHALNPRAFRPDVPQSQRRIDIGVRAIRYLPHLGDRERNRLHDYFETQAFSPPLTVDVDTTRLNREGWAAFLNQCRGTISTEAGAWYLERDDRTIEAIRAWTAERHGGGRLVIANDSPLRRLGHKLPWPVRAALRRIMRHGPLRHESTITEELPFDEVFARFFRDYPKPSFYGKCISSRHFDAIGTKTCQIMFPGRFNDILATDEHYLALAPDFSNIDDVLAKFRDGDRRQQIVDQAYDHVLSAHTYTHRIAAIYAAVTAG